MSSSLAQPHPTNAQRIEELGRIIMAYSEVTDKLQLSHDQLMQTVQHLREELSEKNRLLERRNRLAALGEMAAGLAHEIRNPLGAIQLYASMLAKDVVDRPDSGALVKKISAGVKRLEALVGQVLQFSREISVAPQPMDLPVMIEQVVEMCTPQANSANVTIEVDGPARLEVQADPILLGQAVMNLVLNSIEAMPGGGHIAIRFAAPGEGSDARQLHLAVQDNGPGIAPAVLERIFNPFFTTKDTGTGLGLSIVHRVIEAHDGTITATNAPDGGAKFEIRI